MARKTQNNVLLKLKVSNEQIVVKILEVFNYHNNIYYRIQYSFCGRKVEKIVREGVFRQDVNLSIMVIVSLFFGAQELEKLGLNWNGKNKTLPKFI